jgi:hypothetical protein
VSRYRWTILALGTVAQASYSAVFLGIRVLAPQLRDEYGLSLTETGVVLAAFSVGSVVTPTTSRSCFSSSSPAGPGRA